MDYNNMKVVEPKALGKEHGLRGYSRLKEPTLITFLQNNLQPTPAPRPMPAPRPKPTPTPRPTPASRPKPTPSVRPKQPDWRPYQLKPKRGNEAFIESPVEQKELPPSNLKQIKHMKKKLGKLNKKIRHSKKDHNNLISK